MSKKRPFKRPELTLNQVNKLFTIKEVVFTEIADTIIHCLIILEHDNHVSGESDYGSLIKKVMNSKTTFFNYVCHFKQICRVYHKVSMRAIF